MQKKETRRWLRWRLSTAASSPRIRMKNQGRLPSNRQAVSWRHPTLWKLERNERKLEQELGLNLTYERKIPAIPFGAAELELEVAGMTPDPKVHPTHDGEEIA